MKKNTICGTTCTSLYVVIVHLRMKEKTELTGPESYVYNQIKGHIENKVI